MNIPLISVTLFIVAIVFIPYYLFIANGKKETKKIRNQIKKIVVENNLNISESEDWRSSYIGIDRTKGKVIYIKLLKPENSVQVFNLTNIKQCDIQVARKVVNAGHKKTSKLDRLDLKVGFINGKLLTLNFYDALLDDLEDFELRRIEKWKGILDHSSFISRVKKVA